MGKSKFSSQYESISSINNLSDVTFYSLAQFVHKYLEIYSLVLVGQEKNILE